MSDTGLQPPDMVKTRKGAMKWPIGSSDPARSDRVRVVAAATGRVLAAAAIASLLLGLDGLAAAKLVECMRSVL